MAQRPNYLTQIKFSLAYLPQICILTTNFKQARRSLTNTTDIEEHGISAIGPIWRACKTSIVSLLQQIFQRHCSPHPCIALQVHLIAGTTD